MSKNVYVIDATEEIQALFKQILDAEGYHITTQSFPLNDTTALLRSHPDLIILDYKIGEEDEGWQALEIVKMTDDLTNIPLIVSIAPSRHLEEMYSYLKEKEIVVLLKPFDSDELVTAAKAALDKDPLLLAKSSSNGQHQSH